MLKGPRIPLELSYRAMSHMAQKSFAKFIYKNFNLSYILKKLFRFIGIRTSKNTRDRTQFTYSGWNGQKFKTSEYKKRFLKRLLLFVLFISIFEASIFSNRIGTIDNMVATSSNTTIKTGIEKMVQREGYWPYMCQF